MRRAAIFIPLALMACTRSEVNSRGEYIGPTGPGPTIIGEPTPQQVAELQLFVITFGNKVRQLPGFSSLYIEHEPRWQVVVAFTRPPPLAQVKRLAPPVLRDRIVVRSATRTEAQVSAALDDIVAALRPLGVDYAGGFDVHTQRFKFTAGTEADAARIRAALPASIRADTDVSVGPLPVPE